MSNDPSVKPGFIINTPSPPVMGQPHKPQFTDAATKSQSDFNVTFSRQENPVLFAALTTPVCSVSGYDGTGIGKRLNIPNIIWFHLPYEDLLLFSVLISLYIDHL